jgi:CheY-like chemotaxis protein
MEKRRVLLVDDDDNDIFLTRKKLEDNNFEVVAAGSVNEALKEIATQSFDVLVTDLHMPEAGDGFAVVTAMRHAQPEALTMVVSGFPDVRRSMDAIVLQADEVVVKPFDIKNLGALLEKNPSASRPSPKLPKESVASILDRDLAITMERWLSRAKDLPELANMAVTPDERAEYLPGVMRNITARLRSVRHREMIGTPSAAAVAHGKLRYRQGYTAPLLVLESRILQISIFETIHRNLATVDFTSVLLDVMMIADLVESQLGQSMESFLTMQRQERAVGSLDSDLNDSPSLSMGHPELFFDSRSFYKA